MTEVMFVTPQTWASRHWQMAYPVGQVGDSRHRRTPPQRRPYGRRNRRRRPGTPPSVSSCKLKQNSQQLIYKAIFLLQERTVSNLIKTSFSAHTIVMRIWRSPIQRPVPVNFQLAYSSFWCPIRAVVFKRFGLHELLLCKRSVVFSSQFQPLAEIGK